MANFIPRVNPVTVRITMTTFLRKHHSCKIMVIMNDFYSHIFSYIKGAFRDRRQQTPAPSATVVDLTGADPSQVRIELSVPFSPRSFLTLLILRVEWPPATGFIVRLVSAGSIPASEYGELQGRWPNCKLVCTVQLPHMISLFLWIFLTISSCGIISVIPTCQVHISYDQLLGQGGAGKVYKGEYAATAVAVKVLGAPIEESDLDDEVKINLSVERMSVTALWFLNYFMPLMCHVILVSSGTPK